MDPIELTSCSPAAKCNLCASITAGRGGHLWVNPESGVEWQSVHKSRWSIEFGEFDGTEKWKCMWCVCEISRDLNSTQYPLWSLIPCNGREMLLGMNGDLLLDSSIDKIFLSSSAQNAFKIKYLKHFIYLQNHVGNVCQILNPCSGKQPLLLNHHLADNTHTWQLCVATRAVLWPSGNFESQNKRQCLPFSRQQLWLACTAWPSARVRKYAPEMSSRKDRG